MDISNNDLYIKGKGQKVFVSSTSHDLEDLRPEIAKSLSDWGFEPIWHESSDFPVKDGLHSHDVCLDEVKECDIYLLIISRRYGGTYAGNKYPKEDISITWYETKIAFQGNKRMLKFVRGKVLDEMATYKQNLKEGIHIKPFHVDNPKVFDFIDFIRKQQVDNWIDPFINVVDLKERIRNKLGIEDVYNLLYFKRLKERLLHD
jgi:hypothetical protein